MDAQSLRTEAARRTGLQDYGDPSLDPALAILGGSLDHEANLHPIGRFLLSSYLMELLVTRLRLAEAWRQRANLLAQSRIVRPLFITGMPRSGSTFLHELLAADPGNRAPRVWEVMFPLPSPGGEDNPALRLRRSAARLWWFRRLAGGADEVHPLRAGSPQECEAIHSYTFLSEEFLSMCWIPAYEAWLRTADFAPTYAWQKKFLQHLQGPEESRWVLKSPDHAHSLGALMAVFPDAVIVQTHREPTDVLSSSLRLIEVLHGAFARPAGREARARREARVLAEAMERLLDFREAHPELAGRFIDVRYSELITDPLDTIRRIYRHWGEDLSPAAAEAMRGLISKRSRYSKGRLRSREVKSGGEPADMRRFDRYCQCFRVPHQRPCR